MKRIFVLSFSLLMFIQPIFAANYLDKQLKSAQHAKKYNSVKIHTKSFDANQTNINNKLKDPKLINLNYAPKIDNTKYEAKLKADEIEYKKQKAHLSQNKEGIYRNKVYGEVLYNLYRITEKIIRANNLDYINWRIVLCKEIAEFNAFTTSANLIAIYSALYDSLYGNDDALAFVVAHELSHQILGHPQRRLDLKKTLRKWVPDGEEGMLDTIYYKKMRDMELEADSEAFALLNQAGYDPNKALSAINFIEAIPNYKNLYNSHPMPKERRENAIETITYLNPYAKEEGKANIYKSKVLNSQNSADRISFVIVGNDKNDSYTPEDYEKRLLRFAYLSYLKGKNKEAIKYFEKLNELSPKYEYYLYLSYAYENSYKNTGKEKLLEKAREMATLAINSSKNNKHAIEQLADLSSI